MSLHCIRLVTAECTRGVIDPLYNSRHNGRDRQYECDRGIRVVFCFYGFNRFTWFNMGRITKDDHCLICSLNDRVFVSGVEFR